MPTTCPKCGTPYPCIHARTGAAVVRDATKSAHPAGGEATATTERYWRQEVISRVRQHRARRRRFDPNASLEFDFQTEPPLTIASEPAASPSQPAFSEDQAATHHDRIETRTDRPRPRKIISFPGPTLIEPQAEPDLELAQPAMEAPRILDVGPEPQQIDLIPNFADIHLEEIPAKDLLADESSLPASPARLSRRLVSGLLDGAIVLAALMIFAGGFAAALHRLAETLPHSRPALVCLLAAGTTLALLFQYVFLVYGKRTPGMGAAGLSLLAFDGGKPSRAACRWRAMAITLSGISLGLGFAWALVDEHSLGWHDRISGTYLKSSR